MKEKLKALKEKYLPKTIEPKMLAIILATVVFVGAAGVFIGKDDTKKQTSLFGDPAITSTTTNTASDNNSGDADGKTGNGQTGATNSNSSNATNGRNSGNSAQTGSPASNITQGSTSQAGRNDSSTTNPNNTNGQTAASLSQSGTGSGGTAGGSTGTNVNPLPGGPVPSSSGDEKAPLDTPQGDTSVVASHTHVWVTSDPVTHQVERYRTEQKQEWVPGELTPIYNTSPVTITDSSGQEHTFEPGTYIEGYTEGEGHYETVSVQVLDGYDTVTDQPGYTYCSICGERR